MTYRNIVLNCFRYLGITDRMDAHIMRLSDYTLRMEAFNLREIDEEYKMHLNAWLHARVSDMKEKNKKQVPIYRSFKDFYDYEKRIQEIEGVTESKTPEHMKTALQMASDINH